MSDKISLEEYERDEIELLIESETHEPHVENSMEGISHFSDEETEIRKTAQALFELEESLLDQHITNIKVSSEVEANKFAYWFSRLNNFFTCL